MDKQVGKNNKLDIEVFTYKVTKDQKVFIYWNGKQVSTLVGKDRDKFLSRIKGANDKELQLIMAKVTGNFKRGNEKNNKNADK